MQKVIDNDEAHIVISEEEVIHTMNKMSAKKAAGPDKIGAHILKKCLSSLLYIIHNIFQLSAYESKMPSTWKIGELIQSARNPCLV